jgi:hypothetical protein
MGAHKASIQTNPDNPAEPLADVTVDLDNPETAAYADSHVAGVYVLRVAVLKNGRRGYAHLSVANFYNGRTPDLRIEIHGRKLKRINVPLT